MKDFKVIRSDKIRHLEEQAKDLINNGWEPVGSANITYKEKGSYMICESSCTYTQSFIKELTP